MSWYCDSNLSQQKGKPSVISTECEHQDQQYCVITIFDSLSNINLNGIKM